MTKHLSEIVEQTRTEPPMKQVQISRKVRIAVAAMVWDGLNRQEAAAKAELSDSALYKALKLPKVKALMAREFSALREGAPMQAYRNILTLGQAAKSEDVRLRSNQWIAGVDGLAPVSKVQGTIKVTHGFEDYDYGAVIDGTARDAKGG